LTSDFSDAAAEQERLSLAAGREWPAWIRLRLCRDRREKLRPDLGYLLRLSEDTAVEGANVLHHLGSPIGQLGHDTTHVIDQCRE
jgi:hypothetical protein